MHLVITIILIAVSFKLAILKICVRGLLCPDKISVCLVSPTIYRIYLEVQTLNNLCFMISTFRFYGAPGHNFCVCFLLIRNLIIVDCAVDHWACVAVLVLFCLIKVARPIFLFGANTFTSVGVVYLIFLDSITIFKKLTFLFKPGIVVVNSGVILFILF